MFGINTPLFWPIVIIVAIALLAYILLRKPSSKTISNSDQINHQLSEAQTRDSDLDESNNDELVAILTAAVTAALSDNPDIKIRVKSFKRLQHTTPIWNIYGRKEYINGKL